MGGPCVLCGRPIADVAFACTDCGRAARAHLDDIANLAGPARDVAHGQNRRGPAIVSGHGGEARLPINPSARERFDAAQNTVITWARHIADSRGHAVTDRPPAQGPPCAAAQRRLDCWHRSCTAIRETGDPLAIAALWMLGHVEWLRHRPEAAEALQDLRRAAQALGRLADRPPDLVVVGACECGVVLYAGASSGTARCRECGERWDVQQSRAILRRQLDGMLMTAAEIATMAVVGDPDANRQRVRKLITVWSLRGRIEAHGHALSGDPLYRFGEVMARLSAESQRSAA